MLRDGTIEALGLAAGGALLVLVTRQGSPGGAVAGLAVATVAILGLGPGTLLPLAIFVLGAGAATRWGGARKRAMGAGEPNEGTRGVRHVAAKLGIPAVLAIVAWPGGSAPALSVAFAAALAGGFADTAATEVGPLMGGPAAGWRERRWVALPHGSVGAVSIAGVAAAAVAAACVGAGAAGSGLVPTIAVGLLASTAGFVAALLESLLAPSAWGRALGHFGRNVFVSAAAAALGFSGGLSGWGMP